MIELEFRNVDFWGGRKPENPEKILEARERNKNKLNSHIYIYNTESRNQTWVTVMRGKCSYH
jgi:hypothetical protein